MNARLNGVSILSAAKFGCLFGVVFGCCGLTAWAFVATVAANDINNFLRSANLPPLPASPFLAIAVTGLVGIVVGSVIQAIVWGVIALVYNLIAAITGGAEIRLSSIKVAPKPKIHEVSSTFD